MEPDHDAEPTTTRTDDINDRLDLPSADIINDYIDAPTSSHVGQRTADRDPHRQPNNTHDIDRQHLRP